MLQWYFQHGWGFDQSFFYPFVKQCRIHSACFLDRGYFYPVSWVSPSKNVEVLLAAHSLGLHFLPDVFLERAKGLVIFAGFISFPRDKKNRLLVRRMHRKLQNDPKQVLSQFYNNCSSNLHYLYPRKLIHNLDILKEDLKYLGQHRLETKKFLNIQNILIIHGSEDKIVCKREGKLLCRELPQAIYKEIEGANHDIPWSFTEETYRLIREEWLFVR